MTGLTPLEEAQKIVLDATAVLGLEKRAAAEFAQLLAG